MKEESPDTETSRRKQVLIVDDERGIVDSLAAIFRRAGYEAVSAYDAASALRHCNGTCPDLVLGDVMMPGMNGIDMAIQIRQRHPECKILLFSAMARSTDVLEEARRTGYDFELVSKPIHPADLVARLQLQD